MIHKKHSRKNTKSRPLKALASLLMALTLILGILPIVAMADGEGEQAPPASTAEQGVPAAETTAEDPAAEPAASTYPPPRI